MTDQHSHSGRYLAVYLVLLALTALSFLSAQLELGLLGILLGLAIAAVKVSAVALYFMHLIEERLLYALVGLATVFWLAFMCAGIAADVGMR